MKLILLKQRLNTELNYIRSLELGAKCSDFFNPYPAKVYRFLDSGKIAILRLQNITLQKLEINRIYENALETVISDT
ncbi:hypothetical protein FNW02_18215 [Komarekiella sp. 'clone 1']|uniref:Uncharacterized protein n=1 Tax=Komarekiella delphini-convector SJRDD-AB1 TaxID=2593771 RepID=A0AA40VS13_9NOST|nr:hypothetical protein [Komarekiella delphini-convector]MBD6617712.1 hypothetical protein [Komarekiella delphini-convector SJRDD-AB1]